VVEVVCLLLALWLDGIGQKKEEKKGMNELNI